MPENAARIWRANGGYQDAPPSPPPPPPPEPPQPAAMSPILVCYPNFGGPGFTTPYQPCPRGQYPVQYGFLPQAYRPYPSYIQGPVGVAGLCRPIARPPAHISATAPNPSARQEEKPRKELKTEEEGETEEEEQMLQKESESEEEPDESPEPTTTNIYAPPPLQPSANYMFDWSSKITMLHVFNKASPIWEPKYWKERPKFKMFHARVSLTVKMVIQNVLAASKEPLDPKEWAATEAIERGGGEWEKGSTVTFDSSRSDGSLMAMGWGPKRGAGMPPVWLVVHRVGFKK